MNGSEILVWLAVEIGPGVIAGGIAGFFARTIGDLVLQMHRSGQERDLEKLRTDYQSTLEGLRERIDRALFAHRSSFETEFRAIKRTWAAVAAVRSSMSLVRPRSAIIPRGETADERGEREARRLEAFDQDITKLMTAVDSRSPFLSQAIFEQLDTLIRLAQAERTEVLVEGADRERPQDWFRRGAETFGAFCQEANRLSQLIRERLEELSAPPGGNK